MTASRRKLVIRERRFDGLNIDLTSLARIIISIGHRVAIPSYVLSSTLKSLSPWMNRSSSSEFTPTNCLSVGSRFLEIDGESLSPTILPKRSSMPNSLGIA